MPFLHCSKLLRLQICFVFAFILHQRFSRQGWSLVLVCLELLMVWNIKKFRPICKLKLYTNVNCWPKQSFGEDSFDNLSFNTSSFTIIVWIILSYVIRFQGLNLLWWFRLSFGISPSSCWIYVFILLVNTIFRYKLDTIGLLHWNKWCNWFYKHIVT